MRDFALLLLILLSSTFTRAFINSPISSSQRWSNLNHATSLLAEDAQIGANATIDEDGTILDDAFQRAKWMMPSIVERALINQDADVDPYQLLSRLDISTKDRLMAEQALEQTDAVATVPVLTAAQCAKLRNLIHNKIQNDGIDNVDGCPDWQVNIHESKLQKILGKKTFEKLTQIPTMLNPQQVSHKHYSRIGVFIRMYSTSKRPWMPFHSDGNDFTLNVALNSDTDFTGGRLMALHNEELQIIERREGDVTYHKGTVYHGVSAITSGTRYSMIMFYHS